MILFSSVTEFRSMKEMRKASVDRQASDEESIEIEAIEFAFLNREYQSAAIPIFKSISPEYSNRGVTAIAYPLSSLLLEAKVTIYCCLRATSETLLDRLHNDENGGWVTVWAVVKDSSDKEVNAVQPVQLKFGANPAFSVLGSDLGFIPFQLDTSVLFSAKDGVGISTHLFEWRWYEGATNESDPKISKLAETTFQFIRTLDIPNYPWGWAMDNASLHKGIAPPIQLLRHAAKWAAGAKTALDVASKLTQCLQEETKLEYSVSPAYTTYPIRKDGTPCSRNEDPNVTIESTALAFRLMGLNGKGKAVDCSDVANIVMLLANILGCSIQVGRFRNLTPVGSSFPLQQGLWLLGKMPPEPSFLFHEVAYIGAKFDETAQIFDACIRFPKAVTNDAPNSESPSDENAFEMVLGMAMKTYIECLSSDPAQCLPEDSIHPAVIKLV